MATSVICWSIRCNRLFACLAASVADCNWKRQLCLTMHSSNLVSQCSKTTSFATRQFISDKRMQHLHSSANLNKFKTSQSGSYPRKDNSQDASIHLLDRNGETLGIIKKKVALKKAEEEQLRLVLVDGKHEDSPVYQLMTGKELAEKRLELRKQQREGPKKRDIKKLTVRSSITERDMEIKFKSVVSWLEKGHPIRITIKNSNPTSNKEVSLLFQSIKNQVQHIAKISQAKSTASQLTIDLRPLDNAESIPVTSSRPFTIEELKEKEES